MSDTRKDVLFNAEDFELLRRAVQLVHDRYDEVNYYMHECTRDRLAELGRLLNLAERQTDGVVLRLTFREMSDLTGAAWGWSDTDDFHPDRDDDDEGETEFAFVKRVQALWMRSFPSQPPTGSG